jgi:hypothetical protein
MTEKGISPSVNYFIPLLQELVVEEGDIETARQVLGIFKPLDKVAYAELGTLLVQCIFKMSEPDLESINEIYKDLSASLPQLDSDFFNVLVCGYANMHDLEHMQEFLAMLRELGMQPTWKTLLACLRSCETASDPTCARQVLKDSHQATSRNHTEVGRFPDDEVAQDYRAEFWELALKMGLVRELD